MSIDLIKWVWTETETTGSTRLVLLVLADQANDQGYCWPSMKTISKKANLSRRYVINILRELEEKGLLQKRKRLDENGDYTSNMYRLVMNNSSLGSEQEDTTPGEQEDTTVVNRGSLKPSLNPKDEPLYIKIKDYYFEIFGRKRWANKKQEEYFREMVVEFGEELLSAIDWAAVKNISDLARIRKAAETMTKPKGKEIIKNEDGSYNV